MLQRALGQKIHHPTPTRGYPVDALATIYKAQNLHTFYECVFLSVGTNLGYSITLTLRHTCRGHLNTVHIHIRQQFAGHHQLLVRQERDAIGLLSVTKRRVHNLHKRRYALIGIYLLRCSHSSVFC